MIIRHGYHEKAAAANAAPKVIGAETLKIRAGALADLPCPSTTDGGAGAASCFGSEGTARGKRRPNHFGQMSKLFLRRGV
jgi:hypothetical protein